MARRKSSVFDDLFKLFISTPWWIGPVVAAAAFVVLRYVVPTLIPTPQSDGSVAAVMAKTFSQVLGPVPAMVAPWIAGLILLIWVASLIGKLSRRNLLQATREMEDLRSLPWRDFELLVGEYYRRRGFSVEERGGAFADGGVDVVLRKDRQIVLVQCKHWKKSKVGVQQVRELLGAMSHEKANSGVFVTTGRFTNDARDFAQQNRIELIDGAMLLQMVQSVRPSRLQDSRVASPSPAAPQKQAAPEVLPSCPKCGNPMTLRTARTGPNAGSQFYGCTKYPECRGTRNL